MYHVITNKHNQVVVITRYDELAKHILNNQAIKLYSRTGDSLKILSDYGYYIEEWPDEQVAKYMSEWNEECLDHGLSTQTSDRWTKKDIENLREQGYFQYGALFDPKEKSLVRNNNGPAHATRAA